MMTIVKLLSNLVKFGEERSTFPLNLSVMKCDMKILFKLLMPFETLSSSFEVESVKHFESDFGLNFKR